MNSFGAVDGTHPQDDGPLALLDGIEVVDNFKVPASLAFDHLVDIFLDTLDDPFDLSLGGDLLDRPIHARYVRAEIEARTRAVL